MAERAREVLMGTFKCLLESGDYSDFVITCGSDTYNVHKSVVCARSEFFKRAERFGLEGANAKVDLPEDEPAIIKLVVQYLYEGEYDVKTADLPPVVPASTPVVRVNKMRGYRYDFPHTCEPGCPDWRVCHHHECRPETCGKICVNFVCTYCCTDWVPATRMTDDSQLLLHAKLYEVADKYDILELKELVITKFTLVCSEHWSSELFAPAAYHVFSTTPESDKGLRDVVTRTIADNMSILGSPAVEALLNEFNGFAVSLLTMRAKELGWIRASDS